MIVPGGGISLDGQRWVSCRPGFFLPVRVLSRLFRRLFLEKLLAAHNAGQLQFFGDHAALADAQAFAAYLAPLRQTEWVVYAKRPFGGPEAVLAYLSRYTHRVAISNSRLIALRRQRRHLQLEGLSRRRARRHKLMTLATDEFIRRFLIHVLPARLPPHPPLRPVRQRRARRQHRASPRAARRTGGTVHDRRCQPRRANEPKSLSHPCPCCGGRMIIIETFERGSSPRYRPAASPIVIRIDTS